MRGKCLMIQGTGSSVGKSVLCSALLRALRQEGLRVAPFKAQNMALNSYVTADGLEMGRAQVTQAQAAGLEPRVEMNPVLLKPTSDRRSQVIVMGKPLGNISAMEYQRYKPRLRQVVQEAYTALEATVDCVVLEGAGSPAEINLREGDLVNMAMAEAADAPVLLVGDIDLGGVFASLYGTVMLLAPAERARVKGVIINKFRGDKAILAPGLTMLEELLHIPVLGVMPWTDVGLEEEDGASQRFARSGGSGPVEAVVVRLPHISNFTDFQALSLLPGLRLRYGDTAAQLEGADILLLPGSKNTIEDLLWLQSRGMGAQIVRHARSGGLVVGICGGYQMLGDLLQDPLHTESQIAQAAGLGLLDMDVTFAPEKTTLQTSGVIRCREGWLAPLDGERLTGYEIHSGVSRLGPEALPWLLLDSPTGIGGARNRQGNVLGAYLHGLFDEGRLLQALVDQARRQKGLACGESAPLTLAAYREQELDRLAQMAREHLDMQAIGRIWRGEA